MENKKYEIKYLPTFISQNKIAANNLYKVTR